MVKWKIGDKAEVILKSDSHFREIGIVDDVLVLGVCVQFDDGSRRIYHKGGELIKKQNNQQN